MRGGRESERELRNLERERRELEREWRELEREWREAFWNYKFKSSKVFKLFQTAPEVFLGKLVNFYNCVHTTAVAPR